MLPYLAEYVNPAIVPSLSATAELLAQDEAYLCKEAAAALAKARRGEHAYDRAALLALPPALQSRAVRMALAEAGAAQDIARIHVEQVSALLGARTGARLHLPGTDAWVEYSLLHIGTWKEAAAFALPLERSGETSTPQGAFFAEETPPGSLVREPFTACFDADKLPAQGLCVRTRLPGDRFFPLNAPGRRKLKEFFIDKKAPREKRDMPLIACGQEILFVPGYCISDTVKVEEKTARILRVTYMPREGAEQI